MWGGMDSLSCDLSVIVAEFTAFPVTCSLKKTPLNLLFMILCRVHCAAQLHELMDL